MSSPDLSLFALSESRAFGERVARNLGIAAARHEERNFEDGEHKIRPLESVRARDVYVVQSLHGDSEFSANDKLCRLLFFVGALKDAGAGSVTAVTPYLCYARKDRKTKTRDPITTRYVAQLVEAVGTDRVVTIDVHNLAAFQNAFRCRTEHLEAAPLFVRHFAERRAQAGLVVASPDVGGIKRAEAFRLALEKACGTAFGSAFMEKRRSAGVVSGERLVGEVGGKIVVILDDLISTGGTMRRAARACREQGAHAVYAVATHGLFVENAAEVVADPVIDGFVVTDTVPPFRLDPELVRERLTILDAAPLFAAAIRRLHEGGSIVELLEVEELTPPGAAKASST